MRGSLWRGRDCNDSDSNIHPGQYDDPKNPGIDKNCNGIFGRDVVSGKPYEDLFCKNSQAKTVVVFGDSASSAFHIPPEWLKLDNINDVVKTLEDEFDWPQISMITGFREELIGDKSIYLKLKSHNRCNHRDYQNIGHNGGKMHSFVEQIKALAITDKPYLAFVNYIGNDVCEKSLDHMTTPTEFERQMITGLQLLDTIAKPGSKVFFVGLVDGRILWNAMQHVIHPLGVPYSNVYKIFNLFKC